MLQQIVNDAHHFMSKWRAEQSMIATKLDSFYSWEWFAKIDGKMKMI